MLKISPLYLVLMICSCISLVAQKKPLDHSVYDGWQTVNEKLISNNGKFIAYTVNPQEGDGVLTIGYSNGDKMLTIARGFDVRFSQDNRYAFFRIKPTFNQARDARIKKKKLSDMPKDSLGMVDLKRAHLVKIPSIESYKLPAEAGGWVAYIAEKAGPQMPKAARPDSVTLINNLTRFADSLLRVSDSLKQKLAEVRQSGLSVLEPAKNIDPKAVKAEPAEEDRGALLTVKNLENGIEYRFSDIVSYQFDKKGKALIMVTAKKKADTAAVNHVIWYHLATNTSDTIMTRFNKAKSFAFDEGATQVAFIAERDSSRNALEKYYKLWHYRSGADSAVLLADRFSKGVYEKWQISEESTVDFSKSGNRIFFGTSHILIPKDTSLPEFERVNVDIWHYNDDNLQTVQLVNLNRELKKTYNAIFDLGTKKLFQLSNDSLRIFTVNDDRDPVTFYGGATGRSKRIPAQWQGFASEDIYAINPSTATSKKIMSDFIGKVYPSATGKYLLAYDRRKRSYVIYNSLTGNLQKAGASIKYPLYDETNDVPDDPDEYGVMGWEKNDRYVYIYDRYDIWQVDPEHKQPARLLNTSGRPDNTRLRYKRVDSTEKFIDTTGVHYFEWFSERTKRNGYIKAGPGIWKPDSLVRSAPFAYNSLVKAKDADVFMYTKENYMNPPDLYIDSSGNMSALHHIRLTSINSQQAGYTWGTAELYKWKAYTGRMVEGILYKPEDFSKAKKYPMILYFYERSSDNLYDYVAPSPTASKLNISFFVSRGYVVFVPDIWYVKGHPGKSAYDHIVSATRALIREGYIDSTRIGLQGQSWGGYQTLHVITKTNLYKAAWAGAPVVNMFSAYGGIRWASGVNRQFQYERTQSRIGATIWEKPELYVENSPLFHLPKVQTPLVIMSNDADGAVPWYQGIELFTAMRRLGKQAWMLNYNGEGHNLVERKNRKDIQIREQQFFDWLLKGEKPAPWISEGVPGILKGRTWGL